MNRQIKFRAQRSDTKEFVYGFYYKGHRGDRDALSVPLGSARLFDCIITEDGVLFDVLGSTVGQFTGVFDKNGAEIYEGDILQAFSSDISNDNFIGKVIYDPANFLIKVSNDDIRGLWAGSDDDFSLLVVGNVYENPDLLK